MEKEVDQRVVIAADEKSQTHPTPLKIFFVTTGCDKSYVYAILTGQQINHRYLDFPSSQNNQAQDAKLWQVRQPPSPSYPLSCTGPR
jgi:hypothetical protein